MMMTTFCQRQNIRSLNLRELEGAGEVPVEAAPETKWPRNHFSGILRLGRSVIRLGRSVVVTRSESDSPRTRVTQMQWPTCLSECVTAVS